jgi:hypothetical protein
MREPSLRTSRLVIAGGTVAALVVGAAGFVAGRATAPASDPQPTPTASPPIAASPTPEPVGVLRRADILALTSAAADALASGSPLSPGVGDIAGRRFELAIPFGCDGPATAESSAPMRWRYDAADQTLRVHVSAVNWDAADWGVEAGASFPNAAEGFWVPRAWSSAETCAKGVGAQSATGAEAATAPQPTLAVAQFGLDALATAQRPERSFDTVKRVSLDDLDTSAGFQLVLTGRVDKLAQGPPIRCRQPYGQSQRPVCVIAVSFEEATVVNAGSGNLLATWSLARSAKSD